MASYVGINKIIQILEDIFNKKQFFFAHASYFRHYSLEN